MATSGQMLENKITGVQIVFVKTPHDTDGLQVVHEVTYPAGTGREYPHVHRLSSETFDILEGQASYQLNGEQRSANTGDTLDFPPRIPHLHPWNTGSGVLKLRQTITFSTPHMVELEKIDSVVETFFGLANDGKVNKDGFPSFLQLLVCFSDTLPELSMPGVPMILQRMMMGGAATVGRLAGIKPRYPQYSGG
jgi:mannose-6-phosphate isomerase-like protein (cupin superfamily)